MRVTVRDVARLAGVSIATASYAVNDRGQVSSLTRRRVQEAARLLNYHPSHAARGLRGRRAQTVGLILPSGRTRVEHAPFLEVLGGVNQAIATAGFDVLLAHSASEADEVGVCKRLILSGKVDALILVRSRVADPRFVELRAQRIPFVVYGRGDTPATHAVEVDNIAGARLAVEHLLRLGHRRIAYLGGPPDLTLSVDRWHGFLQGLRAAGVEVDQRLIGQGELTVDSGEAVFGQLLDGGGPRPTAAFAATDAIALGALRAARARRLEPGRDVALVGFDDVPSAAFAEPPLTTIRQHPHAVGVALGRLVLDQLAGHPIVQPYRRLEPELVVRASCGSAARNGGKLA